MRSSMQFLIAGIIAVCLFLSSGVFAQEEGEGRYYTVTTWKMNIPEDGTQAEFDEMMKEWSEKITRKNDKILNEWVMRHLSGSDSRDLVIITEYASWSDIEAAQKKQNKLMEAAWPDKKVRDTHMKKFGRYLNSHSDEIYTGIPAFGK